MYNVTVIENGKMLQKTDVALFQQALELARGERVWDDIKRYVVVHVEGDMRVILCETFSDATIMTMVREVPYGG